MTRISAEPILRFVESNGTGRFRRNAPHTVGLAKLTLNEVDDGLATPLTVTLIASRTSIRGVREQRVRGRLGQERQGAATPYRPELQA
jgi:hypothetical protein